MFRAAQRGGAFWAVLLPLSMSLAACTSKPADNSKAQPQCTPTCAGAVCGDDGCGGRCGQCNGRDVCMAGVCENACGGPASREHASAPSAWPLEPNVTMTLPSDALAGVFVIDAERKWRIEATLLGEAVEAFTVEIRDANGEAIGERVADPAVSDSSSPTQAHFAFARETGPAYVHIKRSEGATGSEATPEAGNGQGEATETCLQLVVSAAPVANQDQCGERGCGDGRLCCQTSAFNDPTIEARDFRCMPYDDSGRCPAPDLIVDAAALNDFYLDQLNFTADDCAYIEGCIGGPGLRTLLRFPTRTTNRGSRDLHLGAPATHDDLFEYGACHEHYHFEAYATYSLRDASGIEVGSGRKQAFCLMDTEFAGPTGSSNPRYHCEYQGISAGWADTYEPSLDCQWIDITGLGPGTYTLEVAVNLPQVLHESRYDNNISSTSIVIEEIDLPGDPFASCTEARAEVVGPTRDCAWDAAQIYPCTPGSIVEIGCAEACNPSLDCGDEPMLRVCTTSSDSGCSHLSEAQHMVGCHCGGTALFCPETAHLATMTAPVHHQGSDSCTPALRELSSARCGPQSGEAGSEEPNDQPSDAHLLTTGGHAFTIDLDTEDREWYRLAVLQPSKVRISLTFDGRISDLDLYVYDEAGEIVAESLGNGNLEVAAFDRTDGELLIEVRAGRGSGQACHYLGIEMMPAELLAR